MLISVNVHLAAVSNNSYFMLNNYLCVCRPDVDALYNKRKVYHVGVLTEHGIVVTDTHDYYPSNTIVQIFFKEDSVRAYADGAERGMPSASKDDSFEEHY